MWRAICGGLALLLLGGAPCHAQTAPGAGPPKALDGSDRQAIVAQLATGLRERYVFPDVGGRLADALTSSLRGGAYDSLADPAAFAARLDADLAAIAHDKHLRVITRGSHIPGLITPPRSEEGVVRADRLRGGVGYMEISGFPPLESFKPVIDRAMTALAGVKALVIDDRRDTGGDPASVGYLVSFLAPISPPTELNDIVIRTPGTETFTRQPFMSQPTPVRFAGLPIYVLISHDTISGGEELAYDLQSRKMARIVGEVTAGGANPTSPLFLPDDLIVLIPFGRAENPVTKTNWEGRGVQPDIAVPAPQALSVAMAQLGQPGIADLASISERQVFAPRTVQAPGSDIALQRVLVSMASGATDYSLLSPVFAAQVRQNEKQITDTMTRLGRPTGMKFLEVDAGGGDVYEVSFPAGGRRFAVAITADGKVSSMGLLGPAPPAGATPPPP